MATHEANRGYQSHRLYYIYLATALSPLENIWSSTLFLSLASYHCTLLLKENNEEEYKWRINTVEC